MWRLVKFKVLKSSTPVTKLAVAGGHSLVGLQMYEQRDSRQLGVELRAFVKMGRRSRFNEKGSRSSGARAAADATTDYLFLLIATCAYRRFTREAAKALISKLIASRYKRRRATVTSAACHYSSVQANKLLFLGGAFHDRQISSQLCGSL
jgi:hypothetical protein